MKGNSEIRNDVGVAQTVAQFRGCVDKIKAKFEPYHTGKSIWQSESDATDDNQILNYNLSLPPWICQPYIRLDPVKHMEKLAEAQRLAAIPDRPKEEYFDSEGRKITRKLMKKLRRKSRRTRTNMARNKDERLMELCGCDNPIVGITSKSIFR